MTTAAIRLSNSAAANSAVTAAPADDHKHDDVETRGGATVQTTSRPGSPSSRPLPLPPSAAGGTGIASSATANRTTTTMRNAVASPAGSLPSYVSALSSMPGMTGADRSLRSLDASMVSTGAPAGRFESALTDQQREELRYDTEASVLCSRLNIYPRGVVTSAETPSSARINLSPSCYPSSSNNKSKQPRLLERRLSQDRYPACLPPLQGYLQPHPG